MVNQLNFGMQAGQAINENLRGGIDRGRLDSILQRSQDNTSRIDELLVDAMGINNPQMQKTALSFLDQRQKNQQSAQQPTKAQEEFDKLQSKRVSDYMSETMEQARNATDLDFTFSEARKAIAGEITEPGYMAVLKDNPFFQKLFGLTPDEAKLDAVTKTLLADTKGLFGSRPTEREIFILLNRMLPAMGKSYEANLAGLEYLETINEFKKMRGQIVDEITQGGTVYVPNLEQMVQRIMDPMSKEFLAKLQQSESQIPEFKKSGMNEDGTWQNIPGIPDSQDGAQMPTKGKKGKKQDPRQSFLERVRATKQ